jgi:hypothetical protein
MPRVSENVIPRPGGGVLIRRTVELEVPAGTSMLEAETLMQQALQQAGTGMVEEFLHAHDPPLDALERKGRKWTRKLKAEPRVLESTFGAATISRWAYQTSSGGACCYPLDEKMDLAGSATPKFAKSLAYKMAHTPAATVCADLEENHGRTVSVHYVQAVTDLIGAIALEVQPTPDTATLPQPEDVAIIAVGVDGAMVQITVPPQLPREEEAAPGPAAGAAADSMDAAKAAAASEDNPLTENDKRKGRRLEWRNAMVGTIAFYNKDGERLGTIYTGAAPPEYSGDGKEDFWFLMNRELAAVKARYPKARYDGISDGAQDFVPWLTENTEQLTLDFYHGTGYLSTVAGDMVEAGKGHAARRGAWLTKACSRLKHEDGAAAALLKEMEKCRRRSELGEAAGKRLDKSITYFGNNLFRMDYAERLRAKHPIASGVTEAACGLIIKDRMCNRGMRWSLRTAQHIITLRSIIKTTGNCWQNFWKLTFNIAVN